MVCGHHLQNHSFIGGVLLIAYNFHPLSIPFAQQHVKCIVVSVGISHVLLVWVNGVRQIDSVNRRHEESFCYIKLLTRNTVSPVITHGQQLAPHTHTPNPTPLTGVGVQFGVNHVDLAVFLSFLGSIGRPGARH